MRFECVFLDNGGLITDNARRGAHYLPLVGRYFVDRFGGSPEVWEQANRAAWPGPWHRFLARVENWHAGRDIVHEMSLYYADWLRSMFAAAGLEAPASDEECASIGREVDYWINPQIDARFPGAIETIEALAPHYRLFTASDGFEAPLAVAIGPSHKRFERLYGPDLVNVPKSSGRAYYDAIFAHAGVDPAKALVLDDGVANVIAATEAGARAVLVKASADPEYSGRQITRLADLPAIIDEL